MQNLFDIQAEATPQVANMIWPIDGMDTLAMTGCDLLMTKNLLIVCQKPLGLDIDSQGIDNFCRTLIKPHGLATQVIVDDKLKSYGAAKKKPSRSRAQTA